MTQLLRQHFKPEFLNRVDDIVVFHPLDEAHIDRIVTLQLAKLDQLLADKKLTIEMSPAARKLVATEGYDPAFGARPLKRAVQRLLQNPLAKALLAGTFGDGDRILADVASDGSGTLSFSKAPTG